MSREIELTHGSVALVDELDYELVSKYKWHLHNGRYASRNLAKNGKRSQELMHRFILGLNDSALHVDHKDGNGLNNSRSNLRLASSSQNHQNMKKHRDGASRFKGVSWDKNRNRFGVEICVDGKRFKIGWFRSETNAARAYNKAAIQYHGEFARLNQLPVYDDEISPQILPVPVLADPQRTQETDSGEARESINRCGLVSKDTGVKTLSKATGDPCDLAIHGTDSRGGQNFAQASLGSGLSSRCRGDLSSIHSHNVLQGL